MAAAKEESSTRVVSASLDGFRVAVVVILAFTTFPFLVGKKLAAIESDTGLLDVTEGETSIPSQKKKK